MNAPVPSNVIDLARAAPPAGPLPINIEAEQGVLGAALMNNELLGVLPNVLRIEDFSEEIHRRIFDVAVDLFGKGKPATISTVASYLGDGELAPGVQIPTYLARLVAQSMPVLTVPGMAREVRDLAARREMILIGEGLARRARDARPSSSCVEMATESLTELQRLAELTTETDSRRDAAACATTLIDRARAIMRGETRDTGVSTGLPDLDRATGGFQPGTLWIIAGRPRMGKSVLGTGFARKVAALGARYLAENLQGVGSQYFSLELPEDQIIARILADLAYNPRHPVTYGAIMQGALDETELWAVEEAQRRLASIPLALDVAPSLTLQDIAARVRSEKTRMAKRNIRLAVSFVDYLKFVRASERYRGNRVYEVGEISGGLKQLAKAEEVCIVLLAQVNRQVENRDRKDKAPGLADLRDSGDLEADADVVLFIDRESVRIKQSAEYKAGDGEAQDRFIETQNKADLIVAKTRVGAERALSIWFDAGSSTFATEARGGAA